MSAIGLAAQWLIFIFFLRRDAPLVIYIARERIADRVLQLYDVKGTGTACRLAHW